MHAREVTRWRQAAGASCLLLPGLLIVGVDLFKRAPELGAPTANRIGYAACALASALFWAALVGIVARTRGPNRLAAFFVTMALAGVLVGGQLYTFSRYHSYVTPQAALVGTTMLPSVGQQIASDASEFARSLFPVWLLAAILPWAFSRIDPFSSLPHFLLLDVCVASFAFGAFSGAERLAPPDTLLLSAAGEILRAEISLHPPERTLVPGARTPDPVAVVRSRARGNVLLLVTESVRASEVCSTPQEHCSTTPFTNALLPHRFGLNKMRALDSTTAISLGVMWTGLLPTAPRDLFHRAPLLFEFARAAERKVAYLTSQNLMFANSGRYLEATRMDVLVSGTTIDPDATYEVGADDRKLTHTAFEQLDGLGEPFFAVVHLSNTHFPYLTEPALSPFPVEGSLRERLPLLAHYRNAIHRQDAILASFIERLRNTVWGKRTILVFLSDHGEQIREHGAVGHTDTVCDCEIRVPFWIDAPKGVLTANETRHLSALENTPVTMADVAPTMLDLLGIHDHPDLEGHLARMAGASLLRGGTPDRVRVITNCSPLFGCAFRNWGALSGSRKVMATEGDRAWRCYDVAQDPMESHDLGPASCSDLVSLAEAEGRGAPFRPPGAR